MSEGAHLVASQFVKKRYENNLKSIKIFSTSYNIYFIWIRLLINYSLRSLITPLNPTPPHPTPPPHPLQQAQRTRTFMKTCRFGFDKNESLWHSFKIQLALF